MPAPPTWSYRPELDGLRTVAVYLVVLFHAGVTWVGGGFVGVDLFFVLSGFLVTHVIMAETDRDGRFSLWGFYARRVRRLLPAAVVVIAVVSALQLLLLTTPARLDLVGDARASLLYYANWQFIADSRDYFDTGEASSPFMHFWSLSIEEQFYLGFPLVVLIAFVRYGEKLLFAILASIGLMSVGWQLDHGTSDPIYAYYATHARLYQLMAGALLALAFRAWARRSSQPPRAVVVGVAGVGSAAGLIALLLLGGGLWHLHESTRGLLATVAALAAIAGVYAAPRMPVSRMLSWGLPRYLGQISYGTYLWHWPVILLFGRLFEIGPMTKAVVAGVVATGLAALSYEVLEKPIRQARFLDSARWPVVVAGFAVSALVAVTLVPWTLRADTIPRVSSSQLGETKVVDAGDETAKELAQPVPKGIDYAALAEDKGTVGTECDSEASSCKYAGDKGPKVAIVGDSHGAMLTPALAGLAEEGRFQLYTSNAHGCPWQQGVKVKTMTESQSEGCLDIRNSFYDQRLQQIDPDIVVIASLARAEGTWGKDLVATDPREGESYGQLVHRTSKATLDKIRASGAKVILVDSIFGTKGYDSGPDPLECLAQAKTLGQCAVTPPTDPSPADDFATTFKLTMDGVTDLDLTSLYCPGGTVCSPVLDGDVVWRDNHHLSSEFLVKRRAEIWKRLEATGMFGG